MVDEDGEDSDTGELLCRTPSVMVGYLAEPEKTEAVMEGGWVHTGDRVRRDADGNLFFLDRIKDMIKTGGYNVSSQEVERALQSHPAVARAAVVGLPDDYWVEAVTAFVIPVEGADVTADELREHCRTTLASYKLPKRVHLVDAVPVDAQGKILKRELRRRGARPEPSADDGVTRLTRPRKPPGRDRLRGRRVFRRGRVPLRGDAGHRRGGGDQGRESVQPLRVEGGHPLRHRAEDDQGARRGTHARPGRCRDPGGRLSELVEVHLRFLAANRVEHLVSLRDLAALTEEHRERIVDYRRYYQRRVRDVIAAGVRSGTSRSTTPRVRPLRSST